MLLKEKGQRILIRVSYTHTAKDHGHLGLELGLPRVWKERSAELCAREASRLADGCRGSPSRERPPVVLDDRHLGAARLDAETETSGPPIMKSVWTIESL